jgi:hypothetical protein
MYSGLMKSIKSAPGVFENLVLVNTIHKESSWRYKVANPAHQADSDNLHSLLFHPENGVMTWLGQ